MFIFGPTSKNFHNSKGCNIPIIVKAPKFSKLQGLWVFTILRSSRIPIVLKVLEFQKF